MNPLRTAKYFTQAMYASWVPSYRRYDEFGWCAACGRYSRFKYSPFLNIDSPVAVSCEWDEHFIRQINITNSLACSYCYTRFRFRCAAESMLKYFWHGKIRSIRELARKLRSGTLGAGWRVLETTASTGIFSDHPDLAHLVRSEYLDDIPRGTSKGGVRSEDLQALTFPENSFDAVIALDVLEHIPDPMKAFAEVRRVIKPGGVGIITVPLDERVRKTRTLENPGRGKAVSTGRSPFHLDPLRKEGSPVFTEFGMSFESDLRAAGYAISCEIYTTRRSGVRQRVFLLHKNVERSAFMVY